MARYIISRTDSIGDVILTLPVAGMIKQKIPGTEIIFLCRKYTRPVVQACKYVDEIIDWDELEDLGREQKISRFRSINADGILHIFPNKEIALLSKKAGIRLRLGTTNRIYHWYSCNRLAPMSRRRSKLHEAQLNLKLVSGLSGIGDIPDLDEIPSFYGLDFNGNLDDSLKKYFIRDKINVIVHPKSQGSAREWGTDNYSNLIEKLPAEKYNIIITGTTKEKEILMDEGFFQLNRPVKDAMGAMSLEDFVIFITHADALIAGSTGPLHIAAAAGIHAIGIYPPIRPMDPGRWAPLGNKAGYIVKEGKCSKCRKSIRCDCLHDLSPQLVLDELEKIKHGH